MSKTLRLLITGTIVLVAAVIIALKYWDYIVNPWTRDGQVRAQVIQIAPRVSAPIVKLPIVDNQFVKKGTLLFELDPRTFKVDLERAEANLENTRDNIRALAKQVEAARASVTQYEASIAEAAASIESQKATLAKTRIDFERKTKLVREGNVSKRVFDTTKASYEVAQANVENAQSALRQATAAKIEADANLAKAKAQLGAEGEANAQLRAAKAAVATVRLNLEFTRVRAPVDGYVTNLNLRIGDQAVANKAALALIDVKSFWVHAYFKENEIANIRKGNQAIVTLMTYPDQPLKGRVDSIGWGIAQQDGEAGYQLLPQISPTFEWIRLAKRVPVRIHFVKVPKGIALRVGTTASILVKTGTSAK